MQESKEEQTRNLDDGEKGKGKFQVEFAQHSKNRSWHPAPSLHGK